MLPVAHSFASYIKIGEEICYDYGPDDGKMFRRNAVDVDVPAVSDRQDVEVVVPTVSQYCQDVDDVEPAVSFENLPKI